MSRVIIRVEDTDDGEVKVIPVWHPEPDLTDMDSITAAQRTAMQVMNFLHEQHGAEDD